VIVLDASAIVAILTRETGWETLAARVGAANARCMSPVSSVEAAMVLTRHFREPIEILDAWLRDADIVINPIDARQAELARFAFLVYGKGRHPARLNLGDCFSYAAAKALNAPLLFVGNDFARTDVRVA
jgi:ribonuclease VapC